MSSKAERELQRIRDENACTLPAHTLDEKGRCCGRKPLTYKRPKLHYFCSRCNREYDPDGQQQENWGWKGSAESGFVMSETSQRAAANTAARELGLPFPYVWPPSTQGDE